MTDVNTALAALLALLSKGDKPTMGKKGRSSGQRRNPAYKAKAKPTSAGNDLLAIAAFEAKGFKGLTPDNVRSLVKTYGKAGGPQFDDNGKSLGVTKATGWLAEGRKVMAGQKGIKVGPFTLFHRDQTEVIGDTPAPKPEQPKAVATIPVPVLTEDEIVAQAKAILAVRVAQKAQAAALQAEYGV